jgi:hypothetical protein
MNANNNALPVAQWINLAPNAKKDIQAVAGLMDEFTSEVIKSLPAGMIVIFTDEFPGQPNNH